MSDHTRALRFPYVLFDLGSTLIYFDGDWQVVMAQASQELTYCLRRLGYNLDSETFPDAYYALTMEYYRKRNDRYLEYTAEQVLQEALRANSYLEPPQEHLRQSLKVMYGVMQQHWHLDQQAPPVLETLLSRGHHLGIISNAADDDDVQTLVDNAQLRPYFDFILTSAQVGVRKPNPQIFKNALAFWGARHDQCVMVGDTLMADIAGARQLGMASVWVRQYADAQNPIQSLRPDVSIFSLSELPALLENWPQSVNE